MLRSDEELVLGASVSLGIPKEECKLNGGLAIRELVSDGLLIDGISLQ